MHYTPISPPGAARARLRLETPAPLAERRRQRLERLVARFERDDIEAAVDGLIAMLDQLDGDTDREDGNDAEGSTWPDGGQLGAGHNLSDDHEAAGDEHDASFPEWAGRPARFRHGNAALGHEDAEDDDPTEDDDPDHCLAGDDGCAPIMTDGGIRWGAPLEDADREAWTQPATLERPIPANDTVPA